MKVMSFAIALAFLAQGAAKPVPVASHDDLQIHFSAADKDGDGKLDLTELTLRLKETEFIHESGREAHMAHEAELDKKFEEDKSGMTKDGYPKRWTASLDDTSIPYQHTSLYFVNTCGRVVMLRARSLLQFTICVGARTTVLKYRP